MATVHVESWRSTYAGLVPDDYLAGLSVARRVEVWRELIAGAGPERSVLVLDHDAHIIGFCHFASSRDDDAVVGTGEVTSIYVMAAWWRHGGGTQLLNAALSALAAAGYRRARLWVLDRNDRARRFYEARGWVHDGAVKVDDRGTFQLRELRYASPALGGN